MEDTWLGPYKVHEVTNHGCCILQCIKSGVMMKRTVNGSQLKLYYKPQVNTKMNEDEGSQSTCDEEGEKMSGTNVDEEEYHSKTGRFDEQSIIRRGDEQSKSRGSVIVG